MSETSFQNVTTNNAPLPERVADQIAQLIITRNLKSGDKLPNEFELATHLNVGRGTVREAVKILVARNILTIKRGKGTFITKHPGQVEDPFGFAFYTDRIKLAQDLLEVRMHLEPWVAYLAAQRATPENIALIKERCSQVEDDILNGVNHLPNDIKLHISIAECTKNDVVPKLIPVISYSVDLLGSLNKNSLRSETIITHRSIVDAIAAHDPDAAREAMIAHLDQNKKTLDELVMQQKARENGTESSS
jgi:DNA-binding FadR family transcriptional regulator